MSGTWPDKPLIVTGNSSMKELHLSAISVAPCVIYGLVWQASVRLNTIHPLARSLARAYVHGPSITSTCLSSSTNPDTSARTAEKPFLPFRIISCISLFMCAPPPLVSAAAGGHQLRMRPHLCWETERQAFEWMVNDARWPDSSDLESFGGLGICAPLTGQFGRNHFFLKQCYGQRLKDVRWSG